MVLFKIYLFGAGNIFCVMLQDLLWMRKRKRAEGKHKRDHPYVAALIVGGSVRQDEGGAVERSVTRVCSLCEV